MIGHQHTVNTFLESQSNKTIHSEWYLIFLTIIPLGSGWSHAVAPVKVVKVVAPSHGWNSGWSSGWKPSYSSGNYF